MRSGEHAALRRREEPLERLLGYHLRRASVAAMTELSAALSPIGLTPAAASVLFVIGSRRGSSQSEIGRSLGILRANMAPLVAGLTARGWVVRSRLDGRSHGLGLTAAGETLRRKAWAITLKREQQMFGDMHPRVRRDLIARLRTIAEARGPGSGSRDERRASPEAK